MNKIRLLILLTTLVVVGSLGWIFFLYAKGFRFDTKTGEVSPNGLLVIKSHPDSAQIFLNGELKTATNATISLPPGTYDVSIRKEGYAQWNKRLTIEQENVTESTAHLFKQTPSLSAVTIAGALNPVPSPDMTKLSYVVPPQPENRDSEGLWIMETLNLPLGFAREPRRLTDGDLTNGTWMWSPDASEILLTIGKSVYLLKTNEFTSQAQRVNMAAMEQDILAKWEDERKVRANSQLRKLPSEVQDVMLRRASAFVFSQDEDMILYTASSSAELPPNLIPHQLPGSSTQKQERSINPNRTYVYDIKEDRNFLIIEDSENITIEGGKPTGTFTRRLSWFPTSRNVILGEPNQIVIMDYDGTNRQIVYQGIYTAPHAYPTLSLDRLIVLTNLGANGKMPDLYSLSIK
jgi:hypothetical protein